MQEETHVRSLGWEDPLEKEITTHSSILSWRIPWTEEPDRLQSTVHGVAKELNTTEQHFFFSYVQIYVLGFMGEAWMNENSLPQILVEYWDI